MLKSSKIGSLRNDRPKKTIKVQFRYFWNGFNYKAHFGFLLDRYNILIDPDPDYIIYSCFLENGGVMMPEMRTKAIRIFYTGENIRPDMNKCDYAISFCYDDDIESDRHFRLPNYTVRLWACGHTSDELVKADAEMNVLPEGKTRFCNFIFSNAKCDMRNRIFFEMEKYKPVHAGGALFNNLGEKLQGHQSKLEFMRSCKFSIAFENASSLGYTTEKIVEAMLARTIPIYWGNPQVERDFNPKSFINFSDCGGTLEGVAKRVMEIDQNEELYLEYLSEPFLNNNEISRYLNREYIFSIFDRIFA
jgi:hypothetical protein